MISTSIQPSVVFYQYLCVKESGMSINKPSDLPKNFKCYIWHKLFISKEKIQTKKYLDYFFLYLHTEIQIFILRRLIQSINGLTIIPINQSEQVMAGFFDPLACLVEAHYPQRNFLFTFCLIYWQKSVLYFLVSFILGILQNLYICLYVLEVKGFNTASAVNVYMY